jgi:chorismate-pyruvate lyase
MPIILLQTAQVFVRLLPNITRSFLQVKITGQLLLEGVKSVLLRIILLSCQGRSFWETSTLVRRVRLQSDWSLIR